MCPVDGPRSGAGDESDESGLAIFGGNSAGGSLGRWRMKERLARGLMPEAVYHLGERPSSWPCCRECTRRGRAAWCGRGAR
jgi:hypothetical protein